MRTSPYLLLSSLLVLLSACGDDSSALDDAGPTPDAGPLDSAVSDVTTSDAPAEVDAGPSENDAGLTDAGPPRECSFSVSEGLGDNCFPACSEGSLAQVAACTDNECYRELLVADPSPPLRIESGNDERDRRTEAYLTDVERALTGCHQCDTLVARACEYEVCPEESMAFMDCILGLTAEPDCSARASAVADCTLSPANSDAAFSCYSAGTRRCLQ